MMCCGHAERLRELDALALPARHRERRAGVGHRVQVEQVVDAVVERPQLARARRARRSCAGRRALPAVHRRLKSSSTQRDANGSARIEASRYAATLAKHNVSVPRVGRKSCASSQSSAIAPQTSLPCVSAWTQHVRARRAPRRTSRRRECRCCRPPSARDRETRPRSAAAADRSTRGHARPSAARHDADAVGEPAHERFAARELLDARPIRSAGAPARCGRDRR